MPSALYLKKHPSWTDQLRLIAMVLLSTLFLHACSAGDTISANSGDTGTAPPPSGGGGSGGGSGSDTTAPNITISGPTSSTTYTSSSASLTTLAGTASDNVGVTQVSWSNNLGGSGTASGTTSWSVGSIALQSGTNVITVTARDAANNTRTDTISISYSAGGGGGGSTTEIPTASGASLLSRYPYLQTDSANRMKILWATTTSGTCEVQYKLSSDTVWTTQPTCSEQLYSGATTGLGANFYQHEVTLTGLLPNTSYTYNVIHDGTVLARNVGFTTMKEASNATTQFIVIGDSGIEYSTPRQVRDAIASKDGSGNYIYAHDFIVGVGDIAYYSGTYTEFDQNFFGQLSGKNDGAGLNSILATRPFFPVLGNHEYGNSSTSTPTGYLSSFSLPVPSGAPSEDAERYYSFDSGNAHLVVIDSEKFSGDATATRLAQMLSWLDADLAATTKTWRLVFLHRTIFSNANHGTWGDIGENRKMRQQLAPILQNRGVQLVMFGHDHAYQRSKRLRVDSGGKIIRDGSNNVVDSSAGIIYVLTGIGGADMHDCQADPSALFGSAKYTNYVSSYGDGYDFVASRNNAAVLFSGGGAECTGLPTTPAVTERYGFTQVIISGSTLNSTTYNLNGVIMDQFSMPAN